MKTMIHCFIVAFYYVCRIILPSMAVFVFYSHSCVPKEMIALFFRNLMAGEDYKTVAFQLWEQCDRCLCVNSSSFLFYPVTHIVFYHFGCYSKFLYNKIRDDNFLVGRTLQNINRNP